MPVKGTSRVTNQDVKARLGELEQDMHDFRDEMKVAMRSLTDTTTAAIKGMEKAVSHLQINQVQQQAQSTSIPQILQGAGAMLGIVTAISIFVIFTIDARTVDLRRDVQHATLSQSQSFPALTARLAQLEARDAAFEAQLSGIAQQSSQHADWFAERHKRANEYYERGKVANEPSFKPAPGS